MKCAETMSKLQQASKFSSSRRLTSLWWGGILVGMLAGCTGQQSPPRLANPNRYIYVTAASLPGQCYRDLGEIGFDEPFAAATIDEGGARMASQLRTLAVAKYPNDVDAVINVLPQQNDAGTAVKITGEAVEIVNHPTITCALRDLPPLIDASAASANAGIIGTIAGGLITGSPSTAMEVGTSAAGAAGTAQVVAHQLNQEAQRDQMYRQLLDEQRQIRDLLTERARLNTCEEQEIPLASCHPDSASESKDKNSVSASADYENLSSFELQKQSAENQDYITKLKQQISDTEWQMGHPSVQ
jgi:hypothetical protein